MNDKNNDNKKLTIQTPEIDLFEEVFKEKKSNWHQHQCLKEAFKKRDLLPIYAYYEKQRKDFDYRNMFYFYNEYDNTQYSNDDINFYKHEYFSKMVMKIIMDCCPDFMEYLTGDLGRDDIYNEHNKNELNLNYHIKLALQELNKTSKMEKFKKDLKETYESYLTAGDWASISNTKIVLQSVIDYVETL